MTKTKPEITACHLPVGYAKQVQFYMEELKPNLPNSCSIKTNVWWNSCLCALRTMKNDVGHSVK